MTAFSVDSAHIASCASRIQITCDSIRRIFHPAEHGLATK